MSESAHQKAVVQFFRMQWPNEVIFAVPNGSWLAGDSVQRAKQMKRMKAEGLEPGILDLVVPVPALHWHGLFIEMKDLGKTASSLSKNQKKMMYYLSEQGYRVEWSAGSDKAISILKEYMDYAGK